jgi:putative transposase
MPWKECHAVDERARFVARLMDCEPMTALCEQFGISRKDRLQDLPALSEDWHPWAQRSEPAAVSTRQSASARRRDAGCPTEAGPPDVGAPKIRERLRQRWPNIPCPAVRTVHAVLDRHGLVIHRRRRRRPRLTGTPLAAVSQPNGLWCAPITRASFCCGISPMAIR